MLNSTKEDQILCNRRCTELTPNAPPPMIVLVSFYMRKKKVKIEALITLVGICFSVLSLV